MRDLVRSFLNSSPSRSPDRGQAGGRRFLRSAFGSMQSLQIDYASSSAVSNINSSVNTEVLSNASLMGVMTGITQKLVKKSSNTKTSVTVSGTVALSSALGDSVGQILAKDPTAPIEDWMKTLNSGDAQQTEAMHELRKSFQKGNSKQSDAVASIGVPIPGLYSDGTGQISQ